MAAAIKDKAVHFEKRNSGIVRYAKSAVCDFGLRYFDLAECTHEGAQWDAYQVKWLNCRDPFRSCNKARQVGFSFAVGGFESVMEALLQDNLTTILLSYNLDEAKEKILYAKKSWDSRHPEPWMVPTRHEFGADGKWIKDQGRRIKGYPDLVKDNILELAWGNGSRIISHPCRPPRGKQASVKLDEFAHYQRAALIYQAALPMIIRGVSQGKNTLTVGSTPAGASGKFHEIHTDNKKEGKRFTKFDVGWWESHYFCSDILAARRAFMSGMDPEEMVERFGTLAIQVVFEASVREDFEQEHCLNFLDSVYAFLSWDLIRSCHPPYYDEAWERLELDFENMSEEDIERALKDIPTSEDLNTDRIAYAIENRHRGFKARGVDKALEAIRMLAHLFDSGELSDQEPLCWGYDVGRHRHSSEMTVFQLQGGQRKQRLMITLPQTTFDDQKMVIRSLIEDLPILRGMIDKGGIGEDIAEWSTTTYGTRAQGVSFTDDLKEMWANQLKLDMERRKIVILPDRDQDAQLHSISRKVTDKATFKYEVLETSSVLGTGQRIKHHADKFWAMALSNWSAHSVERSYSGTHFTSEPMKAREASAEVSKKGYRMPQSNARKGARTVWNRMRGRGEG